MDLWEKLSMDLRKLIAAQTDFSLRLTKQLISTHVKDNNFVFSPLSIHVVLAMVAVGSGRPAREQLLRYLMFDSIEELNSLSSQISTRLLADGGSLGGPLLSIANGVWVERSLALKPAFNQTIENAYGSAVGHVDFRNQSDVVREAVNAWAEEKTNGVIKNLLPPNSVTSATKLILANALYFKGAWASKFNPSLTKVHDFFLLNGSSVRVPFMTSSKDQFALPFDDFKVLKLPYEKGQDTRNFSMYFFLPNARDGLRALVEKFGSISGFIEHHMPHERVEMGDFRLPKFKISFDFEASKFFKKQGLVLPFRGGLTEMVYSSPNNPSLEISLFFHKAYVEVDEQGTEAAAASACVNVVGCSMYSKPVDVFDFVADHPFLFVIREETSGVVLFVGQVVNPLLPFEKLTMDLRQSIAAQTDFSSRLTKQLISTHVKDNNFVFSPLSIHVVLAMVAVGSGRPAREQLLRYLIFDSIEELNSISSQISTWLLAGGGPLGGPFLSIANGIWVERSLALKPAFKETIENAYGSAVGHVDFRNQFNAAREAVNAWAEEKTNGVIKNLLPPGSVTSMTMLILANALYFKGVWASKFNPSLTQVRNFFLLNGSSVRVPFMSSSKDQFAVAFDDFKVLKLLYQEGPDTRDFSMYFFLPNARDGLRALVEKFGSISGFIEHHTPRQRVQMGDFRLPKFKISFAFEASEFFKKQGLVLPFLGGLTEMVYPSPDNPSLEISFFFHKAYVEVDEKGTEAAAVSAGGGRGSSSRYRHRRVDVFDFVADHPFLFVIREETSGGVFFVGQVVNPLLSTSPYSFPLYHFLLPLFLFPSQELDGWNITVNKAQSQGGNGGGIRGGLRRDGGGCGYGEGNGGGQGGRSEGSGGNGGGATTAAVMTATVTTPKRKRVELLNRSLSSIEQYRGNVGLTPKDYFQRLTMDFRQSIAVQTDFSSWLTKQLISTHVKDNNFVFSPLSVHVVLAMVAVGSGLPALEQLLRFLMFDSIQELNSLSSQISTCLLADGGPLGGPLLSFANGVWVERSLVLKPDFNEVVENAYRSAVGHADFRNQSNVVREAVNAWAEEKTNGLIKNLLPPNSVTRMTKLVIANALYFKGAWDSKFDPSRTKVHDFFLLNGSSVRVPFMTSSKDQFALAFDDFKVLKLPYKKGQDTRAFSMYFFLPDARDGLQALVEKFGSISGFIEHHTPRKRVKMGDFRLPKFKISFDFEASEFFKSQGLVLPFHGGLTEMVYSDPDNPLEISLFIHKAYVEVDEKGTEAAAVSYVGMVGSSMYSRPVDVFDFVADHPFLFVIREETSGVVLFVGQVVNPLLPFVCICAGIISNRIKLTSPPISLRN
ncbi:serpin-like protein [Striga asiatica]|uniref:Serpin-like protein n=1 Tax=Striga asiatica TaxID=4170 RepID=A0A5A7R7J3_STRAF|nr:serpin-like protein [Striga asiatica]